MHSKQLRSVKRTPKRYIGARDKSTEPEATSLTELVGGVFLATEGFSGEAGPLWHREGGSGCTLPPTRPPRTLDPPPARPAEAASAVQLKIYDL